MIRLIYFIPIWIFIILLQLPIYILGWVLVPLALLFKAYEVRKSKYWDKQIFAWSWKFMYIWGNEEDGLLCGEELIGPDTFFFSIFGFKIKFIIEKYPTWLRIFYWTVIRNPTNNLRFVPLFSAKYNKFKHLNCISSFNYYPFTRYLSYDDLKFAEENGPLWYLCWQGLYGNYRKEFVMPFTIKIPFINIGYFKGDMIRFWVGHSLYPSAIYMVQEYQKFGAGFKLQLKKVRK